jgi:hypothetical protein
MYQIPATVTMEQQQIRGWTSSQAQQDLLCRSIWRISEDLHTRASYEHPRINFIHASTQRIFKIVTQGPGEEDFNKIFARSSHKDIGYQIM